MNRLCALLGLSVLLACGGWACSGDDGATAGPSRGEPCEGRGCPEDTGGGDTGRPTPDAADDDADTGTDATDDAGGDAAPGDTGADTTPADTTPTDATPTDTAPPLDSDGDGITDRIEGTGDFDEDGIPNHLDVDSDDDGIPDSEEYRRTPGSDLQPSDVDGDGAPDFLDFDSDGDSLSDEEETGCPESTDRLNDDSDSDGVIDMVEIAFETDPCDPDSTLDGVVDFFFELPFEGDEQTANLDIETQLEDGDVVFNMDVTGSMSGPITSLRNSLRSTIIPGLTARIANVGIGITSFADYPCDTYGSPGDRPFALLQRVTTSAADAQAAVAEYRAAGGGDGPESGVEALYQLASGAGRAACGSEGPVPAFDPAVERVEDVADGEIGGVGFRDAQVRVVVHISDISTHARGEAGYPYGATRAEAYAALDAVDTSVIGIAVGESLFGAFSSDAVGDLTEFARESGAVVEPCAWGRTGRPVGCGAGQCCTGVDGRGVSPSGGQCPLVFQVASGLLGGGGGIDQSVISGIEALLGGTAFDVTSELRRDEDEFVASGIDTTCFFDGVIPVSAVPAGCAEEPTPIDTDDDGVLDGFSGVSPGTTVTFEVRTRNDCVAETNRPQVFLAYIDLFASDGSSFGTRTVTILVPPEDPKR